MNNTIQSLKQKAKSNPFFVSMFKHSPKYFSASLINALVGMLMMKYYTAVFTPEQFGILSLYLMLFQYLQNLIAFSFDGAGPRVYFDFKGKELPEFFGTLFIFMSTSSIFWIVVSFFTQHLVISSFGGDTLIYWVTIFLSIVFVFYNVLNRIAFNEHLSGTVLRQSLIQTFLNHFGSFILIAVANLGILSRQLAQLIAYFINSIFYSKNLKKNGFVSVKWVFRSDIFKKLAYFALPSFITTVITASLGYLDRIFLNFFHGTKEVGIYALGLQIGQLISMGIEAISMALFPSLMNELASDYEKNIRKLKRFDFLFCGTLVMTGIIVFLFRDLIVQIFSNKSYASAGEVLPFIIFGYVVAGFYKNISNVLSYHKIVWFYPLLSVASFSFSGLLNYLLIPHFHELGAAYSTFLGLSVYSFVIHLIGSKYYYKLYQLIIGYGIILLSVSLLFFHFIHKI